MKRTLILVVLFALVLAACRQEPKPPETSTVIDVLAAEGFTTLTTAIETAGLTSTLSGEGAFTLLAPTNEAFEALPEGVLEELLADPEALAEVLTYHVFSEEVNAEALITAGAGFYTTVQESPLAVTLIGEGAAAEVSLNDVSTVTEPNLEADNGVVHGIDAVLSVPETEFSATLAGANEVPPVESAATGEVTATLEGTMLTISGSYEGLTVFDSGANIEFAAPDEAIGSDVIPLTFDNAAGTLAATVDLAALEDPDASAGPAIFGWLQNGLLNATLRTEANPNGEIRGQLLATEEEPSIDTNFTASLDGGAEVPPVTTEAAGEVTATLDAAGTTLTLTGTYTGLSSPLQPLGESAGHIHEAPSGANGPVIVPLTLTPDETDPLSGTISGTAPIGDGEGQLAPKTLQGNGYYVNIHTETNPNGEIRGQFGAVPIELPPASR